MPMCEQYATLRRNYRILQAEHKVLRTRYNALTRLNCNTTRWRRKPAAVAQDSIQNAVRKGLRDFGIRDHKVLDCVVNALAEAGHYGQAEQRIEELEGEQKTLLGDEKPPSGVDC